MCNDAQNQQQVTHGNTPKDQGTAHCKAAVRITHHGLLINGRSRPVALNHTTMNTVRRRKVRKFQTPDALPDLRNMPQTFRSIDQLPSPNIGLRMPDGECTAQINGCAYQQQTGQQSFSQFHLRVLPGLVRPVGRCRSRVPDSAERHDLKRNCSGTQPPALRGAGPAGGL